MLRETKVILSLIYRDYICAPEQRKYLLEKDREELIKEEKILREKYNIDFDKRNKSIKSEYIKNQEQSQNKSLIEVKKEKWYQKFIKKILSFLKKK